MRISSLFILILVAIAAGAEEFINGEIWADTDGRHINAHGGGILEHDGTYYWYGENRGEGGGVRVYSSPDLLSWTNRGVALALVDEPGHDIETGCNIERPKAVYNPKTGKFVLWFHLELKDKGYSAARYGVAVSDSPVGPFMFLRSGRVNPGIEPLNGLDDRADYARRDLEGGQMSRDMTIFVDSDGKAYHIYSSEENYTLHIAELTDDYLAHTGRYVRVMPMGHNEAPAVFHRDGRYWMITSGCTGWAPNEARLMTATDIMGPWTQLPNPCRGEGAEKTFGGQSTYILPVGNDGFIAMFDVWRPQNLRDSRYIWLPIRFDADGTPYIPYRPTFDPE